MSTETQTSTSSETSVTSGSWKGAVVAGLISGVVYGIVYSVIKPKVLKAMIPMLIGLKGPVIGWIVHLSVAAVWGVVFAAIAVGLDWDDSVGRSIGLGFVFGAAIWFLDVVIVMPLWMHGVIGFPKAPSFPNWDWMSLWVHLLYGVVVGLLYPFMNDW